MLHKPRCVVIDEALDALDDDAHRRAVNALLMDELKEAAIINLCRPETQNPFFPRVLHLIRDPHGRCFIPGLDAIQPIAAVQAA